MFNSFLLLPTSLSCTVLNDWLDLESLVRLDSAYCSHLKRRSWLELISSSECVCQNFNVSNINAKYLSWVLKRNVKITKLFLCENVDGDGRLSNYMKKSDRFMVHLSVDSTKVLNQDGLSVVGQCRHLHDLKYLGGTEQEDEHLSSVLQNNTKLERLEVRNRIGSDYGSTFSDTPLTRLSNLSCGIHASLLPLFTPALLRLEIHAGQRKEDLLDSAAQQCPQLRSLRCMDSFALAFVFHCPLIVNLSVNCCMNLTDAGVLMIVQKLKHLRTLELFHAGPQLTLLSLDHIAEHCADTLEVLHMFIHTPVAATPSIERFSKLHTFVWYTSQKAYYYWSIVQHDTVTVVLPEDVSIHHFKELPLTVARVNCVDITTYKATSSDECDPLLPTLLELLEAYPALHTIHAHHKMVADLRSALEGNPQVRVVTANKTLGESQFDIMNMPI